MIRYGTTSKAVTLNSQYRKEEVLLGLLFVEDLQILITVHKVSSMKSAF